MEWMKEYHSGWELVCNKCKSVMADCVPISSEIADLVDVRLIMEV